MNQWGKDVGIDYSVFVSSLKYTLLGVLDDAQILRVSYYDAEYHEDCPEDEASGTLTVKQARAKEKVEAQKQKHATINRTDYFELWVGKVRESKSGKRQQKRVDTQIAVDMVTRAFNDQYDVAVLISGDDDFVNVVRSVKDTGKQVRLDIVGGVDVSHASTKSEYRNFVDNNRLPIEQKTELGGTTITGSVKYALVPRGREVGSVAWVPTTIVPYVGAGGGAHWYKLTQQGDFVDALDLSVFTDFFESSGWKPSVSTRPAAMS